MADIGAKIAIDGEKQFKQELANITQAGKTLSAQMDTLTSSFQNNEKTEEDAIRVSQKLNEQIENQQKLIDKLKEAVQRSADKTGENSTETLKWKEKLAKAETALSSLQSRADDTGKEVEDLTAAEKDATEQTSVFGDVLKANLVSDLIKKGVQALANAVKDVSKFFVDAVKGAADYADEVNELATVTGMSTDAIQEYRYAADLLDTDFSTIQGSLTKLTSSMSKAQKGSGDAADAFDSLGVRVTNADGTLRSANDVFDDAVEALGKIDNETERDAKAMQIFGKSAKDLNPLIKAGAKTLGELRQEAHDVGAVMEGETLESMSAFKDGLDRLKNGWDALKNTFAATLGAKLLPDLEKFVGLFQDLLKTGDIDSFMSGVTDMFKNLIKKLPTFVNNVLKEVPRIIKNLANSGIFESMGAAIGDALAAILTNAPAIIEAGIQLCWGLIKGVVMIIPNLVDKLVNGFRDTEVKSAVDEFAEETKAKVQEVVDKLNEMPTATERIESSMSDLNAKQAEAERWIAIFDELSKKTNPTAEETERLQTAVDKLNELYPELGLAVDNETGKWNMSTAAIKDNIKAIHDRYTSEAYYAAASDTQKEIAALELETKKYRDRRAELRETIKQEKKLRNSQQDLVNSINDVFSAYKNSEIGEETLFRKLSEISGQSIKNVAQANAYYKSQQAALDDLNVSVDKLGIEYDGLSDIIKASDDKLKDLNADVDYLYEQGAAKAEEYARKQEEIAERSEKAAQMRLMRQNALVDDSAKAMARATNNARSEIDRLSVDILDTATGTQEEIGKKWTKIVEDLPDKYYRVGDMAGRKLSQGTAAGIRSQLDVIKQAAANAIQTAINEMKRRAQIKSPSRVTKNLIGKNLALGVIEGWDEEFSPRRLKNTFSLDGAISAMQTSGDTITNNANYGGVTINVSARDGETADAIADSVMRKIQTAVNQRRAVFA